MLTAIIPCLLLMLAGNIGVIAGTAFSFGMPHSGRLSQVARTARHRELPTDDREAAARRYKRAQILNIGGLGLIALGALGANVINLLARQ